jgi:hypothetical protein
MPQYDEKTITSQEGNFRCKIPAYDGGKVKVRYFGPGDRDRGEKEINPSGYQVIINRVEETLAQLESGLAAGTLG